MERRKKAMSLVSQHFGVSLGTQNFLVQDLRIIPHTVQIDLRLSVCESDGERF